MNNEKFIAMCAIGTIAIMLVITHLFFCNSMNKIYEKKYTNH